MSEEGAGADETAAPIGVGLMPPEWASGGAGARKVDLVELAEGELFIVPRCVEHEPVASGETHVLLLEPASTLDTGNVRDARTVEAPERI